MSVDRYPLSWPEGWKRTAWTARKKATFKTDRQKLSVADGADRVLLELQRMGIPERQVIISTNIEPTLTGRPRSSQAEPSDPGVAVYWTQRGASTNGPGGKTYEHHRVMAIDRYTKVADNLAAIAATLEAMRAIERHGGAEILERAFTGFLALPPPRDWRQLLHVDRDATLEEVHRAYLNMVKTVHPDVGGSHEYMAELNAAWSDAQRELKERISA